MSKPIKIPAASVSKKSCLLRLLPLKANERKCWNKEKLSFKFKTAYFITSVNCIRSEYAPNAWVMYKMYGLICWYKCYKNNVAVSISHWAANLMKLKCVLNLDSVAGNAWLKRVYRIFFPWFLSPPLLRIWCNLL